MLDASEVIAHDDRPCKSFSLGVMTTADVDELDLLGGGGGGGRSGRAFAGTSGFGSSGCL